MFNPVRTRIEDVLNAPTQFAIPIYQRDFKWGKEEALDLVEDIRNCADTEGETLYLGTIILESSKEKKTFVVDGQQRLTTILLLLIACRMRAIELGFQNIGQSILAKVTFIDAATGETEGVRLIASESIRDVFDYITKDSWKGEFPLKIGAKSVKRQAAKIRPIYDYFRLAISDYDKERLSKFLRAIYNSFVIRIDIESDTDALSIFERTNARGMELEISDLLKNYLFAEKVEGIEDLWGQIVDNSGGTILRMLKYFYVSRRGYVLKPQLYRKLKGHAAEVGPEQFTKELADYSNFYNVARNVNEANLQEYFERNECSEIFSHAPRLQKIKATLEALHEFGVTQFYPPAYAAIKSYIRTGGHQKEAKALVRLFEVFEKYHFINNVICERVGNEVEKLYADACEKFSETENFIETATDLINELIKKLAKEGEFIAKFSDLSYSSDQISILSYIFDRFNNYNLEPGQHVRIYNPDSKLLRRTHNIEHVLPQKPSPDLKVKKDTLEYVDNIGNLLAISYKTNSSLGNASPAKKCERLKGDLARQIQNLEYVREFLEKYSIDAVSWNKEKIVKRAQDMAEKAYREVWKIK